MATKKRFNDSTYSGNLNSARRLERQDFSMISEDKSACANLPQQVMYKPWPKGADYADYALDDTIKGINEQEKADVNGMKRHKGGNKW
jgi:hypothetical protein